MEAKTKEGEIMSSKSERWTQLSTSVGDYESKNFGEMLAYRDSFRDDAL